MKNSTDKKTARKRRGIAILGKLSRIREGSQYAKELEAKYGALGSFYISFVMGEIWSRKTFKDRDKCIVTLSILGSLGSTNLLKEHVSYAISCGLKISEIREIFVQLCIYAGFARVTDAMEIVDEALKRKFSVNSGLTHVPAADISDKKRKSNGSEIVTSITGVDAQGNPQEVLRRMVAGLGNIGQYAALFAFGQVWSRDELSRRERSLVVVASLATLGRFDELEIHAKAAMRHGLERYELNEIMILVFAYAGAPFAVEASKVMHRCLE